MIVSTLFRFLFLASSYVVVLTESTTEPPVTGGPTESPVTVGQARESSNDSGDGYDAVCVTDEKIKKGETHPICIVLGYETNWTLSVDTLVAYQAAPETDKYAKLHFKETYQKLIGDNSRGGDLSKGITFFSGVGGALSLVRMYYDPDGEKVFPFITAIIEADRGEVKNIYWDNSCGFCSKSRCVENTLQFNGNLTSLNEDITTSEGCYLTRQECDELISKGEKDKCDINIYVAWKGSDVDNKKFDSFGYRFSAFPPTSSIKSQLKDLIPDFW